MSPQELKPRDALRFLKEGMELERKAWQSSIRTMLELDELERPEEVLYLPEGNEDEPTDSKQ